MENLFKSENTLIKVLTYAVTIIIALVVFNFVYKKIMSKELFSSNSVDFNATKIVFVGDYNTLYGKCNLYNGFQNKGYIAIVLDLKNQSKISKIEIYINNESMPTNTITNIKNGLHQLSSTQIADNFKYSSGGRRLLPINQIRLKAILKNDGFITKTYPTTNNIFFRNQRCGGNDNEKPLSVNGS